MIDALSTTIFSKQCTVPFTVVKHNANVSVAHCVDWHSLANPSLIFFVSITVQANNIVYQRLLFAPIRYYLLRTHTPQNQKRIGSIQEANSIEQIGQMPSKHYHIQIHVQVTNSQYVSIRRSLLGL